MRATRKRQRHLAELGEQTPAVPSPRMPTESTAGVDTAANVAHAHQIAVQLVLAGGHTQALAEQLQAAQTRIAELTTRAEQAEAQLAEQRRHYEDRLWLLGELPRPTRPA